MKPGRDAALDALRTLALWLMVMSHLTRRVEKPARVGWNDGSMLLEPYTAASFLFLVGCSLVWSQRGAAARGEPGWYRRIARKAAGLWCLSFLGFWLEFGVQWPAAFTTSGVLASIAWSMVGFGALLTSPWPKRAVGAAVLGLLAVFAWADAQPEAVFWLTAGQAPLLPDTLFAGCGVLFAWMLLDAPPRARRAVLGLAGVTVLAMVATRGFEAWYSAPLGRRFSQLTYHVGRDGFDQAVRLLRGAALREKGVRYFDPTLAAFPFILGNIVVAYGAFSAFEGALRRPLAHRLLAVGRHALGCYLLHLGAIAVGVAIWGPKPFLPTPAVAAAALLGLLGLCYAWALVRDAGGDPFPRLRRWVFGA